MTGWGGGRGPCTGLSPSLSPPPGSPAGGGGRERRGQGDRLSLGHPASPGPPAGPLKRWGREIQPLPVPPPSLSRHAVSPQGWRGCLGWGPHSPAVSSNNLQPWGSPTPPQPFPGRGEPASPPMLHPVPRGHISRAVGAGGGPQPPWGTGPGSATSRPGPFPARTLIPLTPPGVSLSLILIALIQLRPARGCPPAPPRAPPAPATASCVERNRE